MARSLRATLAGWLVVAGLAVFAMSLALSQNAIERLADSAYDRSLSGALRAIEADVAVVQGGLGIDLPYALFATLQATTEGTVYFRIRTGDGLVQIGDTDLPEPPRVDGTAPRFFDAEYLGDPIRVGAIRTRLDRPLYGAPVPQTLLIEVAETTASRDVFLGRIARLTLWRDAAVLAAALAVMVLGTHMALRPLGRLRDRVVRRADDDLAPLGTAELPTEVRPLVESFNALLARHAAQAAARRRFLDDASHQLRTPMSVLRMQLDYALAAQDSVERDTTLHAMRAVVDRATRTAAQLLALARIEETEPPMTPVDLAEVARNAAMLHLPLARRRGIDLDLDLPDTPTRRPAIESFLFEALSNLLDNAIRLSPKGSTVEVTVTPHLLRVADQGPGMSDARLAQVGERFVSGADGSGLGLALAQTVAQRHGGDLRVANRTGGGLCIDIRLP